MHTITQIFKDINSRIKTDKTGNIVVLLPKTEDNDIIIYTEDLYATICMYKKPDCNSKEWLITNTHTPILINSKYPIIYDPLNLSIEGNKLRMKSQLQITIWW